LTFSDLILEVLHFDNPSYEMLQNDNVVFNHKKFNLIQDENKNNISGLQQLNTLNQIRWNTQNIINYLSENPQIKFIYFTRKPTGIWAEQIQEIANHECLDNRLITNIFTPSGQGKPVYHSMERLLHHWLHNDNPIFGNLDENWLGNHGINIYNF
jgi:hypothetical protein